MKNNLLWRPSPDRVANTSLFKFIEYINLNKKTEIKNFSDLHAWSVENRHDFWDEVWNFYRVIGCGAYICKPNTFFTIDWLNSVHGILDQKYELLKNCPANNPRDFYNKRLDDGSISNYPLVWSEICGQIFHPLCLKYSKKILKTLPTPDFNLPYL